MASWSQWKKIPFLLWYGAVSLLSVALLALLVTLWMSGGSETKDAFESGRRLLIKLDGGEIQGKLITLDVPREPSKDVVDASPKPEEKPEEKSPEPAAAVSPEPEKQADATPVSPEQKDASAEPALATNNNAPLPAPDTLVVKPAQPDLPRTAMTGVNMDLLEKTENGELPVIAKDGTKPWRFYSKPFERKNSQPMVAIVVTGLGHNKGASDGVLKLPEQVTVGFSPYVKDPSVWMAAARATGHEMLIEIPLQPANYPVSDPGPYGLFVDKGVVENEKRLQWLMSRFPTSMGFLTPQNEVFTDNSDMFKALLQSLANRGLMLVVGREPHRKETRELIDASSTAITVGDILLDEELSVAAIQTRLATLEQQAKKNGYAIGIARAYPITVEQLREWTATLAEKGIVLVPVSAIVKLHFS